MFTQDDIRMEATYGHTFQKGYARLLWLCSSRIRTSSRLELINQAIEEKIIDLQTKKQHLADQILNGESVSMSSLSKDDFMEILNF